MNQLKTRLIDALIRIGQLPPGRALVQMLVRLCQTTPLACRMLDHPAFIMLKRGTEIEPLWQKLLADPCDERTAFRLRNPRINRQAATAGRIAELTRIVDQHPDAAPAALCLSAWLAASDRVDEATALNQALACGADPFTKPQSFEKESLQPTFLIIGMPKSGTTSLFNFLSRHPQVKAPILKEIRYWSTYYEYGRSWYLSHFPPAGRTPGVITGEATAHYIYEEDVPARIVATVPQMKLVLLVRNPVDRAYSHFQMNVRSGERRSSWPHYVDHELARLPRCPLDIESIRRNQYSPIARSVALPFIQHWLEFFAREQMLILPGERLFVEPQTAVRDVTDFLNLPPVPAQDYANINPGKYQSMDPAIRRRLDDYFAPYHDALEDYLQIPFNWQSLPSNLA